MRLPPVLRVLSKVSFPPVAAKAVELLKRTVKERTGAALKASDGKGPAIELSIESGIGAEGFRIEDGPRRGVRLVGNDPRGLLYGVGKFLRDARFAAGRFTPGPWRGTSVPARPVRGMYFATHFHNFYHEAPEAQVRRYIEEMALWGCNALSVWFDFHHFDGIGDPDAQAMIGRLHAILDAANSVGMGGALTLLSNEGYNNSPEALRADGRAGQNGYFAKPGGFYAREICPSKAGGMEQILRDRREMFEAFADVNMEYVWLWPYDQGGCTCATCAPWGTNGFLRCSEAVAGLVREFWPGAKTVLSTWYFDKFTPGEWEGLSRAFAGGAPKWVDYLMADDFGGFPKYPLQHGVPGRLPMLGFAEISMENNWPWGGWGANPRPLHWQSYWEHVGPFLAGGFPYSEGIFEDINKVLTFQLAWGNTANTWEILREYAAYEYGPRVADEVVTACEMMEAALGHYVDTDLAKEVMVASETLPAARLPSQPLYRVSRLFAPRRYLKLLDQAAAKMPPRARRAWRWRVLWLRAALDVALHESGGVPTRTSEKCLRELAHIYRAEKAEWSVYPIHYAWLREQHRAARRGK